MWGTHGGVGGARFQPRGGRSFLKIRPSELTPVEVCESPDYTQYAGPVQAVYSALRLHSARPSPCGQWPFALQAGLSQ